MEISRCGGFFWIKGMGKESIKSAGVLKWVFENVQKRSKIFENIRKRSKIFENIRKYSNFLQVLAHLIDFTPLAVGAFY